MLAKLLDDLNALRDLKPGWDSYGALPPSELALRKARVLVIAFAEVGANIHHVGPLVDGGVDIVFNADLYNHKSITIENDGSIVAGGKDDTSKGDWTWSIVEEHPLAPAKLREPGKRRRPG